MSSRRSALRSTSWTRSTYARPSAPRRRRSADCLVVEEREDGLPERHRLDREEAVPAGVQLVDDDVRALVAAAGLVVGQALDDVEVEAELAAGGDDVLRPLTRAARGRVDDARARGVRGRRGSVLR